MRYWIFLSLFFAGSSALHAQTADTAVIRNLETKMKMATVTGDTAAFFSFFAPECIVNSPVNRVVTLPMVMMFTRAQEISYSSYDLRIEKISVIDNIGISMGQETVVPKDAANHLGKTVTRRYTDIWMKRNGTWQLLARQATEIDVK